jgi:hypothetical protein
MAEKQILSFESASRLHQRRQQLNSSSTIPSMWRDDDTIRDFASQFVPDEVFGSDKGCNAPYPRRRR